MASSRRKSRYGHMVFVGDVVYCPRVEKRVKADLSAGMYQEFVCPGCGVRIPASRPDLKPRRNVQIELTKNEDD